MKEIEREDETQIWAAMKVKPPPWQERERERGCCGWEVVSWWFGLVEGKMSENGSSSERSRRDLGDIHGRTGVFVNA